MAGSPRRCAAAVFGWPVASAGDVNGDGFPDLIVGAKLNDAAGAAYVYLIGPPPLPVAGATSLVVLLLALAGAGTLLLRTQARARARSQRVI